jgi:hypothetical protein
VLLAWCEQQWSDPGSITGQPHHAAAARREWP